LSGSVFRGFSVYTRVKGGPFSSGFLIQDCLWRVYHRLGRQNALFQAAQNRTVSKMVSYIREVAPQVTVYFCMEDDEVWQKSLGFLPSERGGLPNMLDESAKKHCCG